jgi:hypothetical protein
MTVGQVTEREAALAARVKELEDAAAKSAVPNAQGGVFESISRTISYLVPPKLAAVALAVFIAHYGFGYYLQSQVTAAETQLKQAKADVETAKAKALNDPDAQGVTMRLATMKAQLDNTRAEAAAGKAKATALNADVNGETAALASAKAQLDNIQNQARVAQTKADAAGARFGLSTLRDREVSANVELQKLETIKQRTGAALTRFASGITGQNAMEINGNQNPIILRTECADNEYAEEIGCPSQFIQRNRQQTSTTPENSDAGVLKAGAVATIKALNANLRQCPEASNRCAPLTIVPQGQQVKITELAGEWVKVDVPDAARHGTWHGYLKTNVLIQRGEQ